jgi:DUF1680 family protein
LDWEFQATQNSRPPARKSEIVNVISLETTAKKIGDNNWSDQLYKEVSKQPASTVNIKLIPYYTWGNRGHSEMSVWLPVSR